MNVTCKYCRATNTEEDNRCQRCGRRLHAPPPQAVSSAYSVTNTATARVLRQSPPQHAPVSEAPPATADSAPKPPTGAAPRHTVYQRPLFSSRELPQVVPFESIAPQPPDRPRAKTEPSRPRARQSFPGQQMLEFSPAAPDVEMEPAALIYCDAPVAIPAHRIMAAAVDLSIIAIALGLFLGVFQLTLTLFHVQAVMGLTKQTLPFFALIAAVFGLLYKILWCLADGDSAGMRWAQLRLVNFDGQIPDREQRMYRIVSGCLSFMAAGLGVMWALVDEEALTWHDHISKTFPTPY